MKVYDELVARGLIAQVTNEEEIREMIDHGKATFYIGFDRRQTPSMWATLWPVPDEAAANGGKQTHCPHWRRHGHDWRSLRPDRYAVYDDQRDLDHNCQCFKKQMERFIEFGPGKAQW